jgi:hypothetical protein
VVSSLYFLLIDFYFSFQCTAGELPDFVFYSLKLDWCQKENLLAKLKNQRIEDLDQYFAPKPIVDPALDKIIYISPKAKRRFKAPPP